MAVLNRDDFFSRVQSAVGTDTSDDSIRFVEDMTDTFNSLEAAAHGDGTDWEKKYRELDESWKQRYTHRFFSGRGASALDAAPAGVPEETPEEKAEKITIEDLFK